MVTSPQKLRAPAGSPAAEVTQEVRFAVVMYGGVSLCIYINGVAQELLELSRVTAFDANGQFLHTPKGAGCVYRRIAQYLDSETGDASLLKETDPGAPVRTRFVVDVLSGTSAGGLNSLFLAKALANDQDMEGLKNLWMEEGEITRLLNDRESVRGEQGLTDPSAPTSLLNSQRMYKKLLTALDTMDFPNSAAQSGERPAGLQPSPHVSELDCYITATDLTGLPIQLKLDNTVATERRHRNVFHFRYRTYGNDFKTQNNPFLAFAGRCTSAFPFAFEPMCLADIEAILPCWKRYDLPEGEAKTKLRQEWSRRFCRDYADAGCDFASRAFGDGGYLDNKPFSYATNTLMRRRATLPVKRKLIYIDPSPESIRADLGIGGKPDFIANSMAALITLPRYETIREDVQAVLDRNKLLTTVSMLTAHVDSDVRARYDARQKELAGQSQPTRPYEERGLAERVKEDGLGYGTYHRLRVIAVTRNLADMIARVSGFNADSDECQAIRWIIEQWRDANFAEEPEANSLPFLSAGDVFGPNRPRSSQNSFLSSLDVDYRLRRIFFLERRIGELLRLGLTDQTDESDPMHAHPILALPLQRCVRDANQLRVFRTELRSIKRNLAEPLDFLLGVQSDLYEDKDLPGELIGCLLNKPVPSDLTTADRRQRAKDIFRSILDDPARARTIYDAHKEDFDKLARKLANIFANRFAQGRTRISALLERPEPSARAATPITPEQAARAALLPAADQFDDYDAIIFPIQYGTDATEANKVDIVRISPPDAQQLIAEREDPKGRRKLAGTALYSFGAFLARFWRENDMLWGRLDAAEILVRSLLQHSPAADVEGLVDGLVDEAQRAILSETLTSSQREQLWNFICEAFAASSKERGTRQPSDEGLRTTVADLLKQFPDLDNRLRAVLRFAGGENDEELRKYFHDTYEVRRQLVVAEQLRLVTRSGRIISRMLNVVANQRDITAFKKHAALLPRVAAVVWGLVEISIPRSVGSDLWEGWRYRSYTFGVILLVVALVWQPALAIGLVVIGLTLLIDISRWWIADLVRKTGRFKWHFTWLLILFGLIVIGLAAWKAVDLLSLGKSFLFHGAK